MPATLPPAIQDAIATALEQARAELLRFYAEGDIGKVELNCGHKRIVVRALPERRREPVEFDE